MTKSKKSQGLSIGVIIIAVIALIVLVVLISIFVSTTEKTVKNLGNCEAKGGKCAYPWGDCKPETEIKIYVSGDCETTNPESKGNNLCCLKVEN